MTLHGSCIRKHTPSGEPGGLLAARAPTLDVFASSATTKVPGSFYSKYLDIGSKGVDAFEQRWDTCLETGARHLAYINGPFHRMGEIIRKVLDDKVDCILVGPQWPRHRVAVLSSLPIKHTLTLPHWDNICIPSCYVSERKRLARPRHPRYNILAWFILWD